jgi:DNA-binding NtrC family response regulator
MTAKNVKVLFIKDENSLFEINQAIFDQCFTHADIALDTPQGLKFSDETVYDIIINDVTMDLAKGTTLLKHMKQMQPKTALFAFVSPDDEENMGELLDMGVNAFVLTAEQLDPALQAIADMQS